MPDLEVVRKQDSIAIRSEHWEVRHNLRAGGCWDYIRFFKGSGKNLLALPAGSRVRTLDPHPTSDASSQLFYEQRHERNPRVSLTRTPCGAAIVEVEGTYRLRSGKPIPVQFRQRYEYRAHGLIECELAIVSPQPRPDVVEVCALEMTLRPGMTHAYVRDHPIPAFSSDLLGHGRWFDLGKDRGYVSRYVPIHVNCFEKGVEGIEVFPTSELAEWDTGLVADAGMGLYEVRPSYEAKGAWTIGMCPYCVAYRRVPIKLEGTRRFRFNVGLPSVKKADRVFSPYFHAGLGSRWASEVDLRRLAAAGVKLLRFHNDYREDGPFWHDGMYPPYDLKGMAELRRIVDTAHVLGMKIVPYISVKEFHPESPGFTEHAADWAHVAGPTFRELHTWAGSGEFGQVMCLESGWLEFRKRSIETILSDLPWDGLYFDWCTPHPCSHPGHRAGAYHTDTDAFLDFMFWTRERVGKEGIIFTHLSGLPQMVVENLSDLVIIYEDVMGMFPAPDEFPPQCEFIPIAPRHLCGGGGAKRSAFSRRAIMSGILQGTPTVTAAPIEGQGEELVEEMELFAGVDFSACRFVPASARPLVLAGAQTYAALWRSKGSALVYVGNFSPRAAKGAFRLDLKSLGLRGSRAGRLAVTRLTGRGQGKAVPATSSGIPYALKPWGSALFRIEA